MIRTLSLVLVLVFASSVSAQGPQAVTMPPLHQARLSARWDTVFHTGTDAIDGLVSPSTQVTSYTPWSNLLTLDVDTGTLLLRATIPVSYEVIHTTRPYELTQDQAELGDIALEGLANVPLGAREHRLLIGGGVGLPTATDQATGAQIRLVAWESSFRNAQLWVDQAISIWPTIDYRFAIPWLWVSALLTLPIFFPLSSTGGPQPLARGNVDVMFQLDARVALRLLDVVDVGVSFLAWALPSGAGYATTLPWVDLGQTALALSVRSDELLDAPVFGGAEMIFDLDNRWGPTGAPGKLWGLRAFFGARYDV